MYSWLVLKRYVSAVCFLVCGYWWPISLFPWEWSYNWVDRLLTNECNTRKCLRIILGFTHLIVPFLMTRNSRKYISDTFVPFTWRKETHPFRDLFILRCYVDGIVLGLEFVALVIWMSYLNLNTIGNWLHRLIWNVSCSDYCVFTYIYLCVNYRNYMCVSGPG